MPETTTRPLPAQPRIAVPKTLPDALDPVWLGDALGLRGWRAKRMVEQVELIRTVATKVRFAVRFAGSPEKRGFCLKGLLDVDEMTARGGPTLRARSGFLLQGRAGGAGLARARMRQRGDWTAKGSRR